MTQFLSIEDIIINKRASGRPQDLIDVENLLLAQKRNLHSNQTIRPEPQSDED
jgi:hypothetical protein